MLAAALAMSTATAEPAAIGWRTHRLLKRIADIISTNCENDRKSQRYLKTATVTEKLYFLVAQSQYQNNEKSTSDLKTTMR